MENQKKKPKLDELDKKNLNRLIEKKHREKENNEIIRKGDGF